MVMAALDWTNQSLQTERDGIFVGLTFDPSQVVSEGLWK